jgi:hypothetical protein
VTFQNYQGGNVRSKEMANIVIHGGRKYNHTKGRNTRKMGNVVKKKDTTTSKQSIVSNATWF